VGGGGGILRGRMWLLMVERCVFELVVGMRESELALSDMFIRGLNQT
jgi:hypothetical protein